MYRSFESLLVEQCAPALAGIKPACLFRCSLRSETQIRQTAEHWDRIFQPMGLRVQVLKECPRTGDCMIYVYRSKWVAAVLHDAANRRFLNRCGYRLGNTAYLLRQLSQRLCMEQEYPHEIGVFLGYPLADVVGFIENKGENYTCLGCWKSYGDPEEASAYFALCRRCICRYRALYDRHGDVLDLVVAA